MGKIYNQLSMDERNVIHSAKNDGLSLRAIARKLNRPVCTVVREVERNTMGQSYETELGIRRDHESDHAEISDDDELLAKVEVVLRAFCLFTEGTGSSCELERSASEDEGGPLGGGHGFRCSCMQVNRTGMVS